jgi:hypothetical protein
VFRFRFLTTKTDWEYVIVEEKSNCAFLLPNKFGVAKSELIPPLPQTDCPAILYPFPLALLRPGLVAFYIFFQLHFSESAGRARLGTRTSGETGKPRPIGTAEAVFLSAGNQLGLPRAECRPRHALCQ